MPRLVTKPAAPRAGIWDPRARRRAPPPGRRPGRRLHAAEEDVEIVLGIDLGTTNSAVAAVLDGRPAVLADADGEATVPSVVAITEGGGWLAGRAALAAGAGPADTFYSFKRLLGQRAADVAAEAALLRYAVGEGDRGEALIYSPAADGGVPPTDVAACLLRHLVGVAEARLGARPAAAVVAVPARVCPRRSAATLEAAAAAGLRRVHLLQEPVAAAVAYGLGGAADNAVILVADLGGGTFDASVVQSFDGCMEVLATAGDSALGGDDVDAALAARLVARAGRAAAGPDAPRRWALAAAEAAKVALCSGSGGGGGVWVDVPGGGRVEVTPADLDAAAAGVYARMADVLEALGEAAAVQWAAPPAAAAAAAAGGPGAGAAPAGEPPAGGAGGGDRWAPPPRRVTRVALVGQGTRLPGVRRLLAALAGVAPESGVDPGEAVALGAAAHAAALVGARGLGLELMDSAYSADLHGRASGLGAWQP